ncbi:MAG: hypothetical protein H6650_07640 [Ardenticatenales bacterium]|nr:hypothetical protein [Ardenticatenales bacterium]
MKRHPAVTVTWVFIAAVFLVFAGTRLSRAQGRTSADAVKAMTAPGAWVPFVYNLQTSRWGVDDGPYPMVDYPLLVSLLPASPSQIQDLGSMMNYHLQSINGRVRGDASPTCPRAC